ncbi:MAG: SDR family NAD(P)-dependent oxidoreductase [Bacilli bacterium]|nr:SDR family NAD(P)-dependent oxidoreductase [Bacilli bacterium]
MKKILVTGARSGIINKVIDKIQNQYYIYVTVHTNKELEIVKNKYKDNKNIKCLKLDITNQKDINKIRNLDIDIFISNAAISESGSVAEIKIDKMRENFEVNVFSNFNIVQIVLKNMIKKGKGKIIMMGSLAGKIPMPFAGAYSATKASIIKLTESLNLELKLLEAKIDTVLILPGLYNTGFNKLMFDKKYDEMDIETYFNHHIELIKNKENIFLKLFEKKNLDSIVNKIIKAINKENPKFIYSAPLSQNIFAKIVSIFY